MLPDMPSQTAQRLFDTAAALGADERSAYLQRECGDNPALLAAVQALLAGAGAPNTLTPGQLLGAWRIVRVIGRGGMGVVYRAERADEAFQRVVAIKVVRTGRDSAAILDRFRRERETLAALDHPNIARLVDGGSTRNGEPYFVMEYVDGVPVDEYCDMHALSARRRLALFDAICAGVQYAHQHLVVHRDIKPDNILVSSTGIPKLLDFGVARLTSAPGDDTADETPATTWLMTPDYASPEQLAGSAHVTTASDVYSLGVLLYVLLTGRRPYRLSGTALPELDRALRQMTVSPPSTAVRQPEDEGVPDVSPRSPSAVPAAALKGDLDAIVMKALARDPAERYATVGQLADDLTRHRTQHPVQARRAHHGYRARCFVRRHTLASGLSIVLALLLLGGSGVVLRQARATADARALAERRFNDVRQLAGVFMFDVHDAIVNVPGTTEARALVVNTGVRYLESLVRQAGDDRDLQRELARAFIKVGDAQGRPTNANLGDVAGALGSYRQAVTIASGLVADERADIDASRLLALAHRRLADVLAWVGDLEGARAESERSHAMFTAIAGQDRPTFDDVLELAIADIKMGDLLGNPNFPNLGRAEAAAASYEAALGSLTSLEARAPGDDRVERFLGLTFERIGTMHEAAGRLPGAVEAYQASFRRRMELARTVPFHTDVERDVAIAYEKLGNVHRLMGSHSDAEESYRGALARFERLYQVDPSNAGAIRSLAISEEKLSLALADSGATVDEARRLLQQARWRHEAIVGRDATNAQAQCDVARVDELAGDVDARNGRGRRAACQAWRDSLARHRSLAVTAPDTCSSREAITRLTVKAESCG